jgi:prepilin-type N-terminal cleavage/methylation domain-containing protein
MIRLNERGYTLLEMMAVLAILALVVAVAVSRLYTGSSAVGGAERVLDEVAARLGERRAEAVRLNGEDRRLSLEQVTAPPLPINFAVLPETASLRIEGQDENSDCLDDFTHAALTCLRVREPNSAVWELAFNDDALRLPDGWTVLERPDEFTGLPLIGDGLKGRGVLATAFAFNAQGLALAREPGSANWLAYPTGTMLNSTPHINDAPFWAVYFVVPGAGPERNRAFTAAVAVAVHPSGLVEKFRFDDGQWLGFNNRLVQ